LNFKFDTTCCSFQIGGQDDVQNVDLRRGVQMNRSMYSGVVEKIESIQLNGLRPIVAGRKILSNSHIRFYIYSSRFNFLECSLRNRRGRQDIVAQHCHSILLAKVEHIRDFRFERQMANLVFCHSYAVDPLRSSLKNGRTKMKY
jgi:hypothetical protein